MNALEKIIPMFWKIQTNTSLSVGKMNPNKYIFECGENEKLQLDIHALVFFMSVKMEYTSFKTIIRSNLEFKWDWPNNKWTLLGNIQ